MPVFTNMMRVSIESCYVSKCFAFVPIKDQSLIVNYMQIWIIYMGSDK
jgi:hypothetical protein